jgi:hypothetical protein
MKERYQPDGGLRHLGASISLMYISRLAGRWASAAWTVSVMKPRRVRWCAGEQVTGGIGLGYRFRMRTAWR